MTAGTTNRLRGAAPESGDVLDHLTIAYIEIFDRYGPLMGMDGVTPPVEDVAFAAEQNRKAEAIDQATDPAQRAGALLDKEAHRHEQIGRLAFYIAGYEAAHGDPDAAPPMRELGWDHAELAATLRQTMEAEAAERDSVMQQARAVTARAHDLDEGEAARAWEGEENPEWDAAIDRAGDRAFQMDDSEADALAIGLDDMAQYQVALAQMDDEPTSVEQGAAPVGKLQAGENNPGQQPEDLTLEEIERTKGERAFDRARYAGLVVSSDTIKVHPYSAVALPLPENASRALLMKAGQAVALMYANHEAYEHLAPNAATLQSRLLDRAEEIADRLGGRAMIQDITKGRGEFAPPQQPGLAEPESDAVFAGGRPFDPVEELRADIKAEARGERTPDLMADFVTVETKQLAAADNANQNNRDRRGRDV